jgi:hypothetical protein
LTLVIILVIWKNKPNKDLETSGGVILITEILEDTPKEAPSIKSITIFLDNKRINRLNQQRDPKLALNSNTSKYFGPEGPFKPLLLLEIVGPLNIEIRGNGPTQTIMFHIPKGQFLTEVYPDFELDQLFSGQPGQKEEIKIYQWGKKGPKSHVETIQAQWSGPKDLFLSTESLTDITSLIKSFSEKSHELTSSLPLADGNVQTWNEEVGKVIRAKNIRYETELAYGGGDEKGWQYIKSPEQIIVEGSANCLDIAILIAIKAINSGLNPYILANSGHALCALSLPDQGVQSAIPLEGTDYLKPPLKPPTINIHNRINKHLNTQISKHQDKHTYKSTKPNSGYRDIRA